MVRASLVEYAHVQQVSQPATTAGLHAMYARINGLDSNVNSNVPSPTTLCVVDTEFAKISRSCVNAIVAPKMATGKVPPAMCVSTATLDLPANVHAPEAHAYLA